MVRMRSGKNCGTVAGFTLSSCCFVGLLLRGEGLVRGILNLGRCCVNVEQVTRDIEKLESLRSQLRSWRTAAALAVVVIVVGSVMIIVNSIKNLAVPGPTREQFVAEFQKGFADDVMPHVRVAAGGALGELAPVVRTEFQKLDLQSPRLTAALHRELKAMQDSLPNRAEKVMESTVGTMLRARESKIRQMYPTLTDEQVSLLMTNLLAEGHVRTVKVMDDFFKPQQDTFDQILAHLDKIEALEADKVKDLKPTWDMAILFFDVFKEDVQVLTSNTAVTATK